MPAWKKAKKPLYSVSKSLKTMMDTETPAVVGVIADWIGGVERQACGGVVPRGSLKPEIATDGGILLDFLVCRVGLGAVLQHLQCTVAVLGAVAQLALERPLGERVAEVINRRWFTAVERRSGARQKQPQ